MANHDRDAKREAFWRGALKRHAASGLTVRAFCRREQLTESAFYFWRRTILERDAEANRSKPASTAVRSAQPTFLPVLVSGHDRHDGAIAIELAGGRTLRLSEAIPPQRLAEIVSALEQTERSA